MRQVVRVTMIVVCVLAAGCTTNVSRFQMPDTDLSQVRTLYVNIPTDEREAAELQSLVAANLKQRGYGVETGEPSSVPTAGDYMLEIAPDWHWDLTWYLLELRIAIYEPENKTLIAQAQSQQSSLVRKNIEAVVERTMAQLFNDSIEPTGEK